MTERVVLIGCGRPNRGDDALGPALLERVRHWLRDRPDREVRLVEAARLHAEHALDLTDADLVLFVSADASAHAPFTLRRTRAVRDAAYSRQELTPEAVLHFARQASGHEPPPAWVLAVRGESFAPHVDLSVNALGHLEVAWDELLELLDDPRSGAWDARAAGW